MHTMEIRKPSLRFVIQIAIFFSYPVKKQIICINPYQNGNVKYLTYSFDSMYDSSSIPKYFVNRIKNTWTEISSSMVTTSIITFLGRIVT